ncbi:MAG: hypothetical protein H0T73_12355 [Ardenticatenales bacterium]|nr:hypothetical protein [Ardenticatenales bacterium]
MNRLTNSHWPAIIVSTFGVLSLILFVAKYIREQEDAPLADSVIMIGLVAAPIVFYWIIVAAILIKSDFSKRTNRILQIVSMSIVLVLIALLFLLPLDSSIIDEMNLAHEFMVMSTCTFGMVSYLWPSAR